MLLIQRLFPQKILKDIRMMNSAFWCCDCNGSTCELVASWQMLSFYGKKCVTLLSFKPNFTPV